MTSKPNPDRKNLERASNLPAAASGTRSQPEANGTAGPLQSSQDDTTPCNDCGEHYYERMGSYWLADDELWADVRGDGCECVICPRCFATNARKQGILIHWEAVRGA